MLIYKNNIGKTIANSDMTKSSHVNIKHVCTHSSLVSYFCINNARKQTLFKQQEKHLILFSDIAVLQYKISIDATI